MYQTVCVETEVGYRVYFLDCAMVLKFKLLAEVHNLFVCTPFCIRPYIIVFIYYVFVFASILCRASVSLESRLRTLIVGV